MMREKPAVQPPPPKVQAVSTQMADFTDDVDTVSTLEASNLVELAAQSGGRILELKIKQGMKWIRASCWWCWIRRRRSSQG